MVSALNKMQVDTAPRRLAGYVLALIANIAFGVGAALAQESLPADGRPLTAVELFTLVKGRSWQWSDGAGRFSDEGRLFTAFTRSKYGATYGEGRFRLTDDGRLCLIAVWHGIGGAGDATTCFQHKQADGVIYQRREDGGDWYPFQHTPLRETDEYAKFTNEDLVSQEFAKIKAELDAKNKVQKGN